ncbi:CP family cyanate transporter-like MFS transporter [Bacilli bacterium PM5-3]|nr:CP family cyanate transporter-like MFS transporter [Bacilli bacterium PM5-3]MDH6603584.1 CP family cyanate transporter-like MFS transporter [Bacilli bacterium PM5-9]
MSTIKKYSFVFLFFAIILTSALLRSTIVVVGPISDILIADLSISATSFGLITTIPLIVFAISSAMIPFIASKRGLINTLIFGLILIIAGCLLRSINIYGVLLLGTILLGFGISIGNVLIPAIIKENAQEHKAIFTSSYLCMQNISASLASGLAIYITLKISWSFALAVWIIPAIIALILWLTFKKTTLPQTTSTVNLTPLSWKMIKSLLKSPYAWSLTFIMALQSVLYYTNVTWLPTIASENGFSQSFISFLMISFQLIPLPGLFLVPILIKKLKQDSYLLIASSLIIVVGILMIMFRYEISMFYIATLLISLGTGSCFAWVVALITNKSKDGQQATNLSAMSQTVGYSLAAIGPLLGGMLVDITNDSRMILYFILASGTLILLTSIYIYFKRDTLSFE